MAAPVAVAAAENMNLETGEKNSPRRCKDNQAKGNASPLDLLISWSMTEGAALFRVDFPTRIIFVKDIPHRSLGHSWFQTEGRS